MGTTVHKEYKNGTKAVAPAKPSLGSIKFDVEIERECVVGAFSRQGWRARVGKALRLLKQSEIGFFAVPELSRRPCCDELCRYLLNCKWEEVLPLATSTSNKHSGRTKSVGPQATAQATPTPVEKLAYKVRENNTTVLQSVLVQP